MDFGPNDPLTQILRMAPRHTPSDDFTQRVLAHVQESDEREQQRRSFLCVAAFAVCAVVATTCWIAINNSGANVSVPVFAAEAPVEDKVRQLGTLESLLVDFDADNASVEAISLVGF